MKRYLTITAAALASVLAFGTPAQARDRTHWNAPLVLQNSMEEPAMVGRRGNHIFLYNQGGNLERTTLVTSGPAAIAEAPLREVKRTKVVTYRTMPAAIAEGPTERGMYRTLPAESFTRTTFITSSESPDLVVERPTRTTVVRTGSQPEAIAEGPVKSTVITTSSEPELIGESYEVRKSGGLFTPDGLSISGRGPHFVTD